MSHNNPRSENADGIVNDNKLSDEQKIKLLYLEHDVPLKIVKDKLRNKKNRSNDQLLANLEQGLKVTLITKEEAGKINKEYRSCMPNDGKSRYQAMEITIIIDKDT